LTLGELTEQLAGVYRAGKPYRFLRQAHVALAQLPNAPDLATLTIRALVEMGYGRPARDLLKQRGDLQAIPDVAQGLRTALGSLSDGTANWRDLDATFQHNVRALEEYHPRLAQRARETCDAVRNQLTLFRSRRGDYHTARLTNGASWHWDSPLSTIEDDNDVKLPERGQLPVSAIVGTRDGAITRAIFERTRNLFLTYSHALYVLEPDEAAFIAWMHIADHAELLAEARLHLFVGPDAIDAFTQVLRDDLYQPVPQLFVDLAQNPTFSTEVRTASDTVAAEREQTQLVQKESLTKSYRDRDMAFWAERLKSPGKVLAVTSRYTTVLQYATRDALAALRRLGWETELIIERADHEQMSTHVICDAIARTEPDMIFFLDHLRYEYPHIAKNIPYLCWVQDPLPNLLCARAGASIGPLDFVCGILKPRCVAEFGYPESQFETVEMPVSIEMFHDGAVPEDDRAQYDCDICFVSNASAPIERLHTEARETYPPELRPVLDLLFDRVRETLERNEFPYDAAAEMTRIAVAECGVELDADQLHQLATFHTYRMLDCGRRQETLEWAAEWAQRDGRTLKIYGRGWEEHPTLAPFAAGVLEHGEPLRRALASARLALQLIPSGIRHQRTYETLACGALPITRYCARDFARLPIAEYVQRRDAGEELDGETLLPGLERIAFETREDFELLAEHYLADLHDREAVMTDLRKVVLEHCTFDAAMTKVMTAFRGHLNRAASQAKLPNSQVIVPTA